jgi:hypothetical protein
MCLGIGWGYNVTSNPILTIKATTSGGAGGNVGIGTTSPNKMLEVFNGTPTSINIITGGSSGAVGFGTINGNVGLIQAYNSTAAGAGANLCIQPSGNVGIGTASPGYTLDINGDCNLSAGHAYRVNGTPIGAGGVTTQTAPARALGTVYQNTTGKAMMITVGANVGTGATGTGGITAFTDSSNPPATEVSQNLIPSASNGTGTAALSFWVLNNNYYKVSTGGSGTLPTVTLSVWTEWY